MSNKNLKKSSVSNNDKLLKNNKENEKLMMNDSESDDDKYEKERPKKKNSKKETLEGLGKEERDCKVNCSGCKATGVRKYRVWCNPVNKRSCSSAPMKRMPLLFRT